MCKSIGPKMRKSFERTEMAFRETDARTSQILTLRRILEGARAKNLQTTILFVNFSKVCESIYKDEQILLAYGLPIETVAA